MSQDEVFQFLKVQRLTGEHKFWRKYEIHNELLKAHIIGVNYGKGHIGRMVNKLYAHGFLDIELDDKCFMVQRFRLNEKHLKLGSPEELSVWFKDY